MSDLLNQASLVMVPSGYKEDTVYSVVPSDGSGDLSFTRASNGTRINSAGLVEVVPWNLVQYSQLFQNGAWATKQGTFTDNFAVAPNGTTTACKWEATNSDPYCYQAYNGDNVSYTATCWVKATGTAIGKNCSIRIGGSAIFTAMTGEWQQLTITANINGSVNVGVEAPESATIGEIVYLWGFQLNIGSTVKPYFPTTDRLNVPRLTYQNGGGGCPSLLLEKQSTNLLTYSEQFDNADWNKIQISATANNTTSPDGTQNADLITTTATGVCYTYELIAGTNGAYSASVYAKNGNNNYLALNIQNSLNNWVTSVFDLSDGSLGEYAQGSGGGIVYVNHTITPVGNGWYRCVLNYTTNQNSYYCPMFAPLKTGNSFTSAYGEAQSNANNKTIYLWGAQLEASSYPTSYIPTTSSSATRVADACFKTGISSLIGQTEGVVFWDIQVETLSATGNENILNIDNGTGFGETIYFAKGSTGSLAAEVYVGATVQCSFSYFLPSVGRYKMALAYKSNDFALYINGVSRGTDSSGSVPTCSRLQMGNGALGSSDGKINQAILFPTRLSNSDLIALTTI